MERRLAGPQTREKKTMSTKEQDATTENTEMGKKLKKAGKKAEENKAERRERTVKGMHLLKDLLDPKRLKGLTTVEGSGFTKITGIAQKCTIYVAKKGGRVDLSGFTLEDDAVTQISEEDARTKHLGKVRGQLNFDKADEAVMSAFDKALECLKEAPAPEEKVPLAKEKPAKEEQKSE
jgi:hypothetical protein